MSVSTMPTWWADRPQCQAAPIPPPRVMPAWRRTLRGVGVAAAIVAVSAMAAALPMGTPETPLAEHTQAAERIQNLAGLWQESHPAQPVFTPQLDRMLPVTDRAPGQPCEATGAPGTAC